MFCVSVKDIVVRFDLSDNKKTRLRTDGVGRKLLSGNLTRTGVLTYKLSDGTTRRELRHPHEVFDTDSLDSMLGAPVTALHPANPVNVSALKSVQKGVVRKVKRDGNFVNGECAIDDDALVAAIERGDMHDVSPGYTCKLEHTAGVYEGERYDAIQREIRYNHLAVGPKNWGRSGPSVALRVDAQDETQTDFGVQMDEERNDAAAEIVETPEAKAEETKASEAETAGAAAEPEAKAGEPAEASKGDSLDVVSELEKTRAERDALKERVDSLTKELADAKAVDVSPLVAARIQLERKAIKIAPEVKLDGLTDREVMLAALSTSGDYSAKSDAYVEARFDLAVESADTPKPAAPKPATREVKVDTREVAKTARQVMIEKMYGKR
jgi:hypothetical protein